MLVIDGLLKDTACCGLEAIVTKYFLTSGLIDGIVRTNKYILLWKSKITFSQWCMAWSVWEPISMIAKSISISICFGTIIMTTNTLAWFSVCHSYKNYCQQITRLICKQKSESMCNRGTLYVISYCFVFHIAWQMTRQWVAMENVVKQWKCVYMCILGAIVIFPVEFHTTILIEWYRPLISHA